MTGSEASKTLLGAFLYLDALPDAFESAAQPPGYLYSASTGRMVDLPATDRRRCCSTEGAFACGLRNDQYPTRKDLETFAPFVTCANYLL